MPRIPLFQQQQLASARTGVPDAGNIGLSVAQGALQTANIGAEAQVVGMQRAQTNNNLGAIATEAFQAVSAELRIRQAQQAYNKKALDESNRAAKVDLYSHEGRLALSDTAAKLKIDNQGNPEAAVKALRKAPDEILAGLRKQYEMDDSVAQSVLKNLNTEHLSENDKLLTWSTEQTISNNRNGVKRVFSDLKARSGLVLKFEDLVGLQNAVDQQYALTTEYFGKDLGEQMMKTAKTDNAIEFLNAETLRNPFNAKRLLEKESLIISTIGGSDRKEMSRTIEHAIDLKEKEVEREIGFKGMETQQEIQNLKTEVLDNPQDRSAVAATRKELLANLREYRKTPATTNLELRLKNQTLKQYESAIDEMDSRMEKFRQDDLAGVRHAEHMIQLNRGNIRWSEYLKNQAVKEEKALQKEFHDSDSSVQARAELRAFINSNLPGSASQVTGNPKQEVDIVAANARLTKMRNDKLLDANEYEQMSRDVNEAANLVRNHHDNLKKALFEQQMGQDNNGRVFPSQRWKYQDQPAFKGGKPVTPSEIKSMKEWELKNEVLNARIDSLLAEQKLTANDLLDEGARKRLNTAAWRAVRTNDTDRWLQDVRRGKRIRKALSEGLGNTAIDKALDASMR
jgi:hypothetical protein